MSFVADQVDDLATRTGIDSDMQVYWENTDCISVFDINETPEQGAKFEIEFTPEPDDDDTVATKADDVENDSSFTASGYTTTATFVGNVPQSSKGYFAVYPYKDYNEYSEEQIYGLFDADGDGEPESLRLNWAGINQDPEINSFEKSKALMVAQTSDAQLHFKNVFAYIKFKTEFPCDRIVISANNDEVLTAQDIVVRMEDGVPVITDYTLAHGSDGSAVVRCDADDDYIAPGTFYVAVMPQTLEKGFKITFYNPNGADGLYAPSKSTDKQVVLTRSKALNIGSFDNTFLDNITEWEGSGTELVPYQIANLSQLMLLATRVNGNERSKYADKHYKLVADIDCKGRTITPIGADTDRAFMGVFDGNNHIINNYVPGTSNYSTGLFGFAKACTIKNLTVCPIRIEEGGSGKETHVYSALVGTTCTDDKDVIVRILNCTTQYYAKYGGPACGNYKAYLGGFVGLARSGLYISECKNNFDPRIVTYCAYNEGKSLYVVGGIVGAVADFKKEVHVTIDRCINSRTVSVENWYDSAIGGIVGLLKDAGDVIPIITNCSNYGQMRANQHCINSWYKSDTFAGGIVGWMDSDGYHDEDPYIVNCYNAGMLDGWGRGSVKLGGIIGRCYDDDTHVLDCASTANWIYDGYGYADRGAICGSDDGQYSHCHWTKIEPYELPIVAGKDDYKYNDGCSREDVITADMMNLPMRSLPSLNGITYVKWVGSTENGDLGLDY